MNCTCIKIYFLLHISLCIFPQSSSQPNTHKGIEKHHPPHNRQQIVDADIHQHSSSEHHQMDLVIVALILTT